MRPDESVVALRPATEADLDLFFRWRNDPFILAHGSSRKKVQRKEHENWFAETIAEGPRRLFIILDQGEPIGQIRFDRQSQHDCVVSVYLLQAFTGRGWGVQAIRIGCAAIFRAWDVARIVACVRSDNHNGRSAFLKAGFEETEAVGACPPRHYSLTLSRRS